MADLKAHATLRELQEYATIHAIERGFNDNDAVRECLLLAEEVGELAKAIRKKDGYAIDRESEVREVAHEIADILWVVTMIANIYNIDLEEAFRSKELINHGRRWE